MQNRSIFLSPKGEKASDNGTVITIPEKIFTDYEAARELLRFRLVSRKHYADRQTEIPREELLDLQIVYHLAVLENQEECASVLVTEEMLRRWGADRDTLRRDAEAATYRRDPPRVLPMREILFEEGEAVPEGFEELVPMLVITTASRRFGAGCILLPEVLAETAERTEGPFILLPSSIHEWIAVPVREALPPRELREMVASVNRTQLQEKDILSYSVYRYDPGDRQIRLL